MALADWMLRFKEMNRDLLLLKVVFFIIYGCGGTISKFLLIHLKERGFNISHLALMHIISPFVQFAAASLGGVIADKIGRSKPVLLGNLFLFTLTFTSFLLLPEATKAVESTITSGECCSAIEQNNFSDNLTDFCTRICKECKNVTDANDLSSFNKTISLQKNVTCNISCSPAGPMNFSSIEIRNLMQQPFNSCATRTITNVSNNDLPLSIKIIFLTSFMIYTVVSSTTFRFIDVLAMCMTNTFHVDYGKIRFWGILGMVILSPIFGFVVQISTPTDAPKNFTNALYLYAVLLVVVMILTWLIQVEDKPPGKNMWKNAVVLVKNVDVLGFFIVVLVLGTGYIFYYYYATIHLNELGASSMLLSLLTTVSNLVGLPCLFTSNWWMKTFGHENLILAALVCYSLMSLGYALLVKVWFALLIETGGVFTYHLLMVALLRHSDEIAPLGLTATVVATAGALHYSIGKATAGIIGGYIMPLGPRWGFGFLGCLNAATAVLGFVFFRIRRKMRNQTFLESNGVKMNE